MKDIIVVCLLAFVAGAYSQQCACPNLKWAACDGNPCTCTVHTGLTDFKQPLNCSVLIPKCFLMKAEMYRARNNLSTRSIGGKPVETAHVDNDGIYDPDCENDGRFKAVQCNNTETCWCVNSAGVRRSDKLDKNIKCEPVETYWVRLEMVHQPVNSALTQADWTTGLQSVFASRYFMNSPLATTNVNYDPDARMVVADVQKPKTDRTLDLSTMAYYMEKDVKVLPMFTSQTPLSVNVQGNNVQMEKILVYYVDEKAPTFTMQRLTGGVIAVIVVVILILLLGLLALFFMRKREKAKYKAAQTREMQNISS